MTKRIWGILAVTALLAYPAIHARADSCGGAEGEKGACEEKSDCAETDGKKAYRVGAKVKDFEAVDALTGKEVKLSEIGGEKGTLLVFWNQKCPFIVECQGRLARFANAYENKGVKVVAIDAGVNNTADAIKGHAMDLPFVVLMNQDSKIAAKFGATKTPEAFLLDKDMKVVYHGAFDSGEIKNEGEERKNYAAEAVQALLEGKAPEVAETKAFGCTLNYAKGVEPLSS